MLKKYVLADGTTRRFEEGTQPKSAALFEEKVEVKAKKKAPANKSRQTKNK